MTPSGSPPVVLVVDDDEDIRDVIREVLSLRGYRVIALADGRQALEWLRAGGQACVILLDLMMPEMTGWEFRREQLRDPSLADIPVVILSGAGGLAGKVESLAPAATLPKPVDLAGLTAAVARHCYSGAQLP